MITLFILSVLFILAVVFFPLMALYFALVLAFKLLWGVAWVFFSMGRLAVVGAVVLIFLFFKIIALLPLLLLVALGFVLVGMFMGHRRRVPDWRRTSMSPMHGTLARMEARLDNLETILQRRVR